MDATVSLSKVPSFDETLEIKRHEYWNRVAFDGGDGNDIIVAALQRAFFDLVSSLQISFPLREHLKCTYLMSLLKTLASSYYLENVASILLAFIADCVLESESFFQVLLLCEHILLTSDPLSSCSSTFLAKIAVKTAAKVFIDYNDRTIHYNG